MSGINPLIDTLLHQVLGKRVDTPPPRELTEPVKPVSPYEALRAVHSDSRLDARGTPVPLAETARTLGRPAEAPSGLRSSGENAPASTQLHLTPSARSIADLLVRFPAPPSVVRSPQPLVVSQAPLPPAQLAERLQGSVRDSGLFYESHLARWYRGELPREQLQREPQMWRTQSFEPVPPAVIRERLSPLLATNALAGLGQARGGLAETGNTLRGAVPPSGMASTGGGPVVTTALPASPGSPAVSSVSSSASETREAATSTAAQAEDIARQSRVGREPIHESLQGIVRHQLETLAMPVLRWEGDVWTGLFMALVMHFPPAEREGHETKDGDARQGDEEDRGWRSEMTLEVAGLGRLGIDLWLRGKRLDLDLASHDAWIRLALEAGIDRLRQRLVALDLAEVRVRVTPFRPEMANE